MSCHDWSKVNTDECGCNMESAVIARVSFEDGNMNESTRVSHKKWFVFFNTSIRNNSVSILQYIPSSAACD